MKVLDMGDCVGAKQDGAEVSTFTCDLLSLGLIPDLPTINCPIGASQVRALHYKVCRPLGRR